MFHVSCFISAASNGTEIYKLTRLPNSLIIEHAKGKPNTQTEFSEFLNYYHTLIDLCGEFSTQKYMGRGAKVAEVYDGLFRAKLQKRVEVKEQFDFASELRSV